jgi:predicted nucleotidyltransferase component of viral defense system
MIPQAQIIQWQKIAPWNNSVQIEQDLILSRIIAEIFSVPVLADKLAFRGGTALHKLFIEPPARYSEDIDLVRTDTGPIKEVVDALRDCLDPWLGQPQKTERNHGLFKLIYKFNPEDLPQTKQRIKIEINTRECFSVSPYLKKEFSVQSAWFTGKALVQTYQLEELLGTKLRALYQRKKGRDLFDLWMSLKRESLDIPKIIHTFEHYTQKQNIIITREIFEKNLAEKLKSQIFIDDLEPLLAPDLLKLHSKLMTLENGDFMLTEDGRHIATEGWNLIDAAEEVKNKILNKL